MERPTERAGELNWGKKVYRREMCSDLKRKLKLRPRFLHKGEVNLGGARASHVYPSPDGAAGQAGTTHYIQEGRLDNFYIRMNYWVDEHVNERLNEWVGR